MKNDPPCACAQSPGTERDRYASFVGLDCDGQAKRLVALLRPYMDEPERSNAFWQLFARKLKSESGPSHDELFLVHAHINILREMLELAQDHDALTLLEQIEMECC